MSTNTSTACAKEIDNNGTDADSASADAALIAATDVDAGMLEYETQLFLDIVQRNGIVIAAKGLCLLNVIANVLRVYADSGNLVLVVNCSEHEERRLTDRLRTCNVNDSLVHSTTYSSALSDDRGDLYLSGGIHFVTTRILVLDLLKQRVPVARITGIIMLNAHKVLESGQEAFVMRLYRQTNKSGFVKAFSNDAQRFTYGFGQLERIMRNLFVREVQMWPRFHTSVIASLRVRPAPDLIELHIPISPAMERIQTCLLELINTLIKDIKGANATVELSEVTVENCLLPKFMRILQTQLDGIWDRLSGASKRLAGELRTLHQLLVRHLFHSDAVGFYAHLQQYRCQEYAVNATWPYYREAEQLFTAARGRVLTNANDFEPEYCPKWKPLFDILNSEIPANNRNTQPATVLILCQDRRTCHQLNQFLRYGPRYSLFLQALQHGVKFNKIGDAFKSCKAILPLVASAATAEGPTKKVASVRDGRKHKQAKLEQHVSHENELEEEQQEEELLKNVYCLSMMNESRNSSVMNESVHEDSQYVFAEGITHAPSANCALSVVIRTFREAIVVAEGTSDESPAAAAATLPEALESLAPAYVVLYQVNVTVIRQLEIYEARKTENDVRTKIFFLVHAGSVEEQSYLTSLRREKQAFEHLIETKTRMVVPEDQDGLDTSLGDVASSSTRAGGAVTAASGGGTVIVDMREFRSELPALLHKRGIHIAPLTITVGDYILTPDICVERKSVADLVGSLNSGRLYAQCTAMQRTYARPMLLIEFDQNKAFSWESMRFMISTDTDKGGSFDVQRKLVLLTLHFPKLRIIWSPNPYATAALFQELKEGKEEPNAAEAAAQADNQQSTADSSSSSSKYNPSLTDMLQRLPGVTSRTAAHLLGAYHDLSHLCRATETQLHDVVQVGGGTRADAKALYAALHGDTAAVAEEGRSLLQSRRGGTTNRGAARNKFKYNSSVK